MPKTALIVVDMLCDFTQPDGLVYYPQNEAVIPEISKALQTARQHGALVVFLQHRYRKGKPDANLSAMRPCCIEGSGGEALDPRLDYRPDIDYLIPKRRYSGFFGTDLDQVLRENGANYAVIVGTKTNCCIRATVNDAYNLGYQVRVISSCVATDDETVNQIHLQDIDKYLGKVISQPEFEQLCKEG